MLRILSAICLCLALSAQSLAHAATDEELRGIGSAGDLKRMEAIAQTGDHRAQAWMGLMLQNRARYQEALQWWTLAAEQGNAWAISNLARMHLHGLGTTRDPSAAVAWYRRGAELGHADSATNLADVLLHGRGIARDTEAARRWLLSATLWGDRYAPARLAHLYADGRDVPRDPFEAYIFARVAAYRLDESENAEVKLLESELARELSEDDLRHARDRAAEIVPQLAIVARGDSPEFIVFAITLCLLVTGGIFVAARKIRA